MTNIVPFPAPKKRRAKRTYSKPVVAGASVQPHEPTEYEPRCMKAIAELSAFMFIGHKDWTHGQVTFARNLCGKLEAVFAAAMDTAGGAS
jgi:hypothetical protein